MLNGANTSNHVRLQFGRPGAHEPDRVACADNLAVLGRLPDACVDLVYIDPPFGTGTVRKSPIGTGSYQDERTDPAEFVGWLQPRLAEIRRTLAVHGSLYCHLDYRAAHYVKVALDRLFGRDRFVNEIVWCYSVGGKSRRSFGRKHDVILWYARSADYAFFPEQVRVARKPASHMRVARDDDGALYQEKTDRRTGKVYRYPVDAGKVPEDWWIDIETLNRGDRERTGYPTQKPERLIERLVRSASQPDWLVADWFCGSGTTGVVAQRLARRFVVTDSAASAIQVTSSRLGDAGRTLTQAGCPPRDIQVEWERDASIRRTMNAPGA